MTADWIKLSKIPISKKRTWYIGKPVLRDVNKMIMAVGDKLKATASILEYNSTKDECKEIFTLHKDRSYAPNSAIVDTKNDTLYLLVRRPKGKL